ncbi:MAG: universal stress protein [Propionivibrio sp.]
MRLLIPVNGSENSLWAVKYALRLQAAGLSPEAVVLSVGEPVNQWQVMQFRTQQEIGQFQSRKAQSCIDEAVRLLESGGVSCRGLFKQGDVVFSILDTAEELECDEIVLPRKKERWAGLFGRSVVQDIVRSQRSIPVVVVNNRGELA